MKLLTLNLIGLVVVVTAAVVHGRWTHRWQPFDRETVNANVERVPLVFGDWVGNESAEDDISTWRDEMDLGIVRRYTNRVSKETVVMMLRGGPPGPIGHHHTPASCYRAVGFVDKGVDQKREVATSLRSENSFWVSGFEKPGPVPQRVRVYWGYTGGKGWVAPKNPRVELSSYDVCYKIYVIRNVVEMNEKMDGDPCESFIRDALPEIESTLFPAKADS